LPLPLEAPAKIVAVTPPERPLLVETDAVLAGGEESAGGIPVGQAENAQKATQQGPGHAAKRPKALPGRAGRGEPKALPTRGAGRQAKRALARSLAPPVPARKVELDIGSNGAPILD
jgi:hypothetical protein